MSSAAERLAVLAAWDEIDADVSTASCTLGSGSIRLQEFIEAVRSDLEQANKLSSPAPTTAAASSAAPQQSQVLAKMRSLVSQEKVRFQSEGFDLDLTYILPNVIAMGFPSYGKESYYRNPVEEVERFFNTRHPNRYRIYNLCSERDYDSPQRFQGRFRRFPFDDHNAPCPIKLIPEFVRDALDFLQQHPENVVAIHCKAGKGRTGVMVSCLLRALDPTRIKSADAALAFFGNVRTADGHGVTIPSQKRYVRYWDLMIQHFQGREPPHRSIQLQYVRVESNVKVSGGIDIYFTVEENNRERLDSRRMFPAGGKRDADGHLVFLCREPFPSFTGDLRFIFYQRNSLLSDEELFHFWVNTTLCQATERFAKADHSLDGRPAKSKDIVFCPNLAIEVGFLGCYVQPMLGTAETANTAEQGDADSKKGSSGGKAAEKGFFKKMFS